MKDISKTLLVLNSLQFIVALPALIGLYGLAKIQKTLERVEDD